MIQDIKRNKKNGSDTFTVISVKKETTKPKSVTPKMYISVYKREQTEHFRASELAQLWDPPLSDQKSKSIYIKKQSECGIFSQSFVVLGKGSVSQTPATVGKSCCHPLLGS